MRERQLASILIQMGLEQGIALDRVVQDVATVSLPTFVDAQAFRGAVVEAAEAHLRAQVEEQINQLRRQLGLVRQVQGRVQASLEQAPPATASGQGEAVDPGLANLAPKPGNIRDADQDLPSDATIIWTQRPDPESK